MQDIKQRSFILDVDKVLCDDDTIINIEYKNWLMKWARNKKVFIASDYNFGQTLNLLGSYLCLAVSEIHHSCGNGVWSGGLEKRKSKWQAPGKAQAWLELELRKSNFPAHITERLEHRSGMLYASVIGLHPTDKEKENYIGWDKEHNERQEIVKEFNYTFQDLNSRLTGNYGLCITPEGKDLRQLVNQIQNSNSSIVYIGYQNNEITNSLTAGNTIHLVDNWQQAWKLLKTHYG